MTTMTARERAAVCVHEAAHAVVAALHGARIETVALTPGHPDHAGRCDHTGNLTASAEAAVTYAGPYAEARYVYGTHPSWREIKSVLDDQCNSNGTGDYDLLVASAGPTPRGVERLIDTAWPAVVTVARQLNAEGRADHAAVCAALGIPAVDGHLSAQASAIRAGFLPTSTR
ncbi:hypothetical protein [Rhodococcus aetherivorans]|uniref:hypothetical protein n=1 Tax=Rhodococcus aetherivorans TaxID=191292 RepID=UPI001E5E5046|nr:hypothetical protein [Rhodococcus aetherivorans]UGQ43401.1 hypothetical protein LRQ66_09020 [Rhodococcus aetherivorans]